MKIKKKLKYLNIHLQCDVYLSYFCLKNSKLIYILHMKSLTNYRGKYANFLSTTSRSCKSFFAQLTRPLTNKKWVLEN